MADQHADLYICPSCLKIVFWFEERPQKCRRCGSIMLVIYASFEAQHLLADIASEEGEEVASIAALLLHKLDDIMLAVKVVGNCTDLLQRKNKDVKRAMEALKKRISCNADKLKMLEREPL
jgi:DNA-directed RNA polymerase subunit RPC12/RpoP